MDIIKHMSLKTSPCIKTNNKELVNCTTKIQKTPQNIVKKINE